MNKDLNSQIYLEESAKSINVYLKGDLVHLDDSKLLQNLEQILQKNPKKISFINKGIDSSDSTGLRIIFSSIKLALAYEVSYEMTSLPENLKELIDLAFSVHAKPAADSAEKKDFLEKVGEGAVSLLQVIKKGLNFLAEIGRSFIRFLSAKSVMRFIDFLSALNECGPKAIGIVSLISFLVGLILAFVGAVQLKQFGAQIYVASLVTIGMCRIMGAIMVGIIMAGRTGSSYAATIGTMQVNEELDALKTMGISLMDFLVLPRLLALVIAMPILTMLSDFLGMVGGAFVGIFMLDIPYQEYWKYAMDAFDLTHFLVGLFHSLCFGVIIAICGCYQGLNSGRNSGSVGIATTKSVVTGIVWMIIATGIITVICQELDI